MTSIFECRHPIDVVKTRLQVSGEGTRNYKALGIGGTVQIIAKEEGIPAFWKGKYLTYKTVIYDDITLYMNDIWQVLGLPG